MGTISFRSHSHNKTPPPPPSSRSASFFFPSSFPFKLVPLYYHIAYTTRTHSAKLKIRILQNVRYCVFTECEREMFI